MNSHGKARPLLMIAAVAAVAAVAAGITACNSGGSGTQYGYDPSSAQYSNVGTTQNGANPNEAGSIGWQNQAQENVNSAISDMGPGGVADPADESNSVSYSGGGDDGSGD